MARKRKLHRYAEDLEFIAELHDGTRAIGLNKEEGTKWVAFQIRSMPFHGEKLKRESWIARFSLTAEDVRRLLRVRAEWSPHHLLNRYGASPELRQAVGDIPTKIFLRVWYDKPERAK